tara:strand:+ start:6249 stop:7319 length:1071 start_codon:yes stop_codon:yes gene_type:complete
MPKPKLPYLNRQMTRHGKIVWYVRTSRDLPRIRLRAEYGTSEFMKEYSAALSGATISKPSTIQRHTVRWLVERYRQSAIWAMSSKGTKKQRDYFYANLMVTAGDVPFQNIQRSNILDAIDRRKETPGVANNFLKSMKALFRWAYESGYVQENPTEGIRELRYKTDGFPAWDMSDVSIYRDRWPIGTRERLAMETLFWTGLRRGDVIRLGEKHIQGGMAMLTAKKTGEQLYISIPETLREVISAGPVGETTIIATEKGRPRNNEAFGNWFRAACREAGVLKSAHGLRKLAASLLAEAGGTEKELQAAFGWRSERQSQLYTRGADRKHLAVQASIKRENKPTLPTPLFSVRARADKNV